MNLAFSQKFPQGKGRLSGKPTYFVQKIWKSIKENKLVEYLLSDYEYDYYPLDICPARNYLSYAEKKHTIRKDTNNRWQAGNDIHFIINPQSPQRFQFAPVIQCVSTQTIEIQHRLDEIIVKIDGKKYGKARLNQLGEIYTFDYTLIQLATNDGFDSVQDFFMYFNTDFKGKIIHWTDIKY